MLGLLIWSIALLAPAGLLGAVAGGLGVVIGVGIGLGEVGFAWLVLPRLAHAAFEAGKYRVAARRYLVLHVIAVRAARGRAALLSRAGCAVAAGELARAERLLAGLDASALEASERAVWLNNRACVALADAGDGAAARALELAEEAGSLRPDVPALQHTRGQALIAVGRVDEAISVLDAMRGGGELPARLEADRCRELARAWKLKGETAYAEDYRVRAEALGR